MDREGDRCREGTWGLINRIKNLQIDQIVMCVMTATLKKKKAQVFTKEKNQSDRDSKRSCDLNIIL